MLEWTEYSMLQNQVSYQNEVQKYWMLLMLEWSGNYFFLVYLGFLRTLHLYLLQNAQY